MDGIVILKIGGHLPVGGIQFLCQIGHGSISAFRASQRGTDPVLIHLPLRLGKQFHSRVAPSIGLGNIYVPSFERVQKMVQKTYGISVSYTHLRAHETDSYLVCRLLLE